MQISFSRSDFWRALIAGELIALLALPTLRNLNLLSFLDHSASVKLAALLGWLIFFPLVAALGLYVFYLVSRDNWPRLFELGKYGIVGILNTFMSLGIFNFFILLTNRASGFLIDFFALTAFVITVTNSFFWNKFWIFDVDDPRRIKSEYVKFFAVSGTVALFNLVLVHLWVNVLGAPAGFDPKLWANIIIILTIPVSFFGNYFGYRIFVFRT
ncbi:MAG: GtrA family protein [bacterium]|nr:GtrA family protein [bacterium]